MILGALVLGMVVSTPASFAMQDDGFHQMLMKKHTTSSMPDNCDPDNPDDGGCGGDNGHDNGGSGPDDTHDNGGCGGSDGDSSGGYSGGSDPDGSGGGLPF